MLLRMLIWQHRPVFSPLINICQSAIHYLCTPTLEGLMQCNVASSKIIAVAVRNSHLFFFFSAASLICFWAPEAHFEWCWDTWCWDEWQMFQLQMSAVIEHHNKTSASVWCCLSAGTQCDHHKEVCNLIENVCMCLWCVGQKERICKPVCSNRVCVEAHYIVTRWWLMPLC